MLTAHSACPLVDDTGPESIALWPVSEAVRNYYLAKKLMC